MSGVASVLTSVFVGLMLAATNFAPLIGWHRFLENRHRVYNAVFLFAGSFLLFMAAILLASIDMVVQYEDQGLFFWNPVLTAALVLGALGLLAFVGAQICMPKPKDYLVFDGAGPLDRLQSLFSQPSQAPMESSRPSPSPEAPAVRPDNVGFRPEPVTSPAFAH